MERIKVIELITGLDRGGAERVVADIARLLPKNRFEVIVVSLAGEGPLTSDIQTSCRVVSLGATPFMLPVALARLFVLLLREKPDILHTHLFHADVVGRILGSLAGVGVIVTTLHNVRYGTWWREWLLQTTSFLVDGFVAVSQEVADRAVQKGVAPRELIRVVYNGIDMDRFSTGDRVAARQTLGIPVDDRVLVNVGRMSEQKGHTYLLEAFALVKANHPKAKLLLAGEGPLRQQLQREAKERGIAYSVVFLGARDDIPTILRAADAFVFSSLWEGFALALAEAMACGRIVVSTRVAGVPEIVQDGESGFLVKPKDARELARAIGRALSLSDEQKKSMEELASSIVHEKFLAQTMVAHYQDFYENFFRTPRKS